VFTTNGFPITRYEGVVLLSVNMCSNSVGAGTAQCSFSIEGSQNGTNNWNTLSNCAVSTPTQIISTNYWATSNNAVFYFTNQYQVPGTISNAVPYNNGFAGQFLVPAALTNSIANYTNLVGGTNIVIGFNADDAPPFLHIIWCTGTNATYTVSAQLMGHPKYSGRFY
jgi:hypothetical protein